MEFKLIAMLHGRSTGKTQQAYSTRAFATSLVNLCSSKIDYHADGHQQTMDAHLR
ncbi:hypothetical protein L915_10162 [Phytophthora nicotianae]|uniref:Uncharacterized protein n=1 Tax=Phytophthora nicotianae TaxID=4792 RepID=W2IXS1_PHYNI|nr:hypothetical protein L915_10162 [Phytophthora nicotianae]ETL38332.1 hypothetical protein L916_10070 [Phytophthora nicotianae]